MQLWVLVSISKLHLSFAIKTMHYATLTFKLRKMGNKLIHLFLIAFILSGCNTTPVIDYVCINSYPHGTTSFTEGFLFDKGKLYESTGGNGTYPQAKSLFGIVNLASGEIIIKAELDKAKYFGEGITFLNGKVYQLTYKTKVGFIYNSITFKRVGEFTLPSKEGWGLTTDGTNLIMSDGTNILTYLDPDNFRVIKKIFVTENIHVKKGLNELEYINDYIYANIWNTNMIIKINPDNGDVVGRLDLSSLAHEAKNIYPGSLEMNGIAYDSLTKSIYVTGKFWPRIYEIKLSK